MQRRPGIEGGAVTEPGIVLGTGTGCCPGESLAQGVAELNGAIYVAGHSRLPGFGEDNVRRPVIMRHDSSLTRIWKHRSGDVVGYFRGVAGAADGFLYAAGHTDAASRDYILEKFSDDGSRQWSMVWDGGGDDALTGITAIGNRIFAAGHTTGGGAVGVDAVLFEIDPATGAVLSTAYFGDAYDDFANGIATDGTDLFVVGETRSFAEGGNSIGDNDGFVLQYSVNQPPVADAGDDQTVECTSSAGCLVTLDGSGSSDPDGDTLSYTWTDENTNTVGTAASIQVTVPLGAHSFTLTVDDGSETDSDTTSVTVEDTTAPSLTVVLAPAVLSPNNHKLQTVTATVTAVDVCDPNPSIVLLSIVSNEPDNGLGDGDAAGDIQGAAFGTNDLTFQLRAERSGVGQGRTYTVSYMASDASGNARTVTATVAVAKGS